MSRRAIGSSTPAARSKAQSPTNSRPRIRSGCRKPDSAASKAPAHGRRIRATPRSDHRLKNRAESKRDAAVSGSQGREKKSAMATKHVLLLSNEPATVRAVTTALENNGKLAPDDVYRHPAEVARRLEQGRCPAVLIDIDQEPHSTLSAVEPLARRFSETRFIVLSPGMQNDLLLEAMKGGARHFLLKDSIVADLHGVIKRLCPDVTPTANGSAVTVLSGGGGCGATTIAVNLAAELNLLTAEKGDRRPSLVMDLDAQYGAVAAYLGVEGEYGIFDLLSRSGS